jgi:hypothetical protein
VGPDGALCVAYQGTVTTLTTNGHLHWTRRLVDRVPEDTLDAGEAEFLTTAAAGADLLPDDPEDMLEYHSAPLALATGAVVISLRHSFVVFDPTGAIQVQPSIIMGDDSGYAPNVTPTGLLVLSTIAGDIIVVAEQDAREMEMGFGYDLLPPAVYADGSLAVGGYYGTGFCRVQPDGQFRWRTTFHEADLRPTLNRQEVAAVGSLNDGETRFFAPDGQWMGTYRRAATLAAYGNDGWIDAATGVLTRLALTGEIRWQQTLVGSPVHPPIVDADGRIYVLTRDALQGWDGSGRPLFVRPLDGAPVYDLALIAPSRLAALGDSVLLLVE